MLLAGLGLLGCILGFWISGCLIDFRLVFWCFGVADLVVVIWMVFRLFGVVLGAGLIRVVSCVCGRCFGWSRVV